MKNIMKKRGILEEILLDDISNSLEKETGAEVVSSSCLGNEKMRDSLRECVSFVFAVRDVKLWVDWQKLFSFFDSFSAVSGVSVRTVARAFISVIVENGHLSDEDISVLRCIAVCDNGGGTSIPFLSLLREMERAGVEVSSIDDCLCHLDDAWVVMYEEEEDDVALRKYVTCDSILDRSGIDIYD